MSNISIEQFSDTFRKWFYAQDKDYQILILNMFYKNRTFYVSDLRKKIMTF